MQIKYTINYDKTIKKLKKHIIEKDNLEKIKYLIICVNNFNDIVNDNIFLIYGFERLKYCYSDFYSFNLNKRGGVIRLIVKPDFFNNILYFVHVSYDHYKDFSIEKGDINEK